MRPLDTRDLELESSAEVFVAGRTVESYTGEVGIRNCLLLDALAKRIYEVETMAPHLPDDSEMPFVVRAADRYLLQLSLRHEAQYGNDEIEQAFIYSMLEKCEAWDTKA